MKKILFVLAAATLAGCMSSPREARVPAEETREREVVMRLHAPGGFDTRAMSDEQQSAVEDVYVLAFAGGELKHIREGELAAGEREFSVSLEEGTFDLTVLANAADIIEDSGIEEGDSYTAVTAALWGALTGKYTGTTIPMWGEVPDVVVSESAGRNHGVVLTRALARIDVGLGKYESGAWGVFESDFELQEVLVFKANDRYALMPDDAPPTIPADTDPLADALLYEVGDGKLSTADIYIAESAVATAAMDSRTAVVVGGSFDGHTTSYYRMDFVVGEVLKDVLRNHLYRFSILEVTGDGYKTPGEAYAAGAVNITFEIEQWNETDIGEVHMDGTKYFGISGREVLFTPFGNQSETITIRTNIPDFSLKMGEQTLTAGGAETTPNYNYSLTKVGDERYELRIECPRHNVSNVSQTRREQWNILASRISMPLTVDQQWTSRYISLQSGQSSRFFPEGGTVPLEIISPVAVTVSSSGAWVGNVGGATTPDANGLYVASVNLTVPPYKYGIDGTSDRTSTITITPQGEAATTYTIIQEAPVMRIVTPIYALKRPLEARVEAVSFDIFTNILLSDLTLSGGTDYITSTAAGLHNIDQLHPRYLRLDTETDFTLDVPVGLFEGVFTIAPDPKYGLADAVVKVRVRGDIHEVTVTYGAGGASATGSGNYNHGQTAAISATASAGYKFGYWISDTPDITFADDTARETTMTVNGPGTVTANFTLLPPLPAPVSPYILYWDEMSETVAAGAWHTTGGDVTQENILFFKFGSVVGFTNNNDAWSMDKIAFEPSTTKATTYQDIPYWNGSDTGDGYISSFSYHNRTNVLQGRGDPCKLVGFTAAQVASGSYDNGLLQLPTVAENQSDYGSGTAVGTPGSAGYGLQKIGSAATFLPAAGYRNTNGATRHVYSVGYYWSSRPLDTTGGYFLSFSTRVSPDNNLDAQNGLTIRCVPQPPKTQGQPPYILYWDDESETMKAGAWYTTGGEVTQENILCFKFGSVVGFTNNNDAWSMDKIVFEPSTTKATTYKNIPAWNGSETTDGYISSSSYHTLANVQAGRGDPCKLAGLSTTDIANGYFDNKKYRLSTDAENVADYGSGTQFIGTQGTSGRGLQKTGDNSTFLPAAGLRGTDGATLNVYSYGRYWSSRPNTTTIGYLLYFNTSVYPGTDTNAQLGYTIRCVPQ